MDNRKENYTFNPGPKSFWIFLNKNDLYVDKTDLIYHINEKVNTSDRFICVTKPRLFGKTVIVDMLTAYYSFSDNPTDIFDDKNLSKKKEWNKYLGKFNVIFLNMVSYFTDYRIKKGIKRIKKDIIDEVEDTIENFKFNDKNDIVRIFKDIQRNTHRDIILIIDEWDWVFRNKFYGEKSQKEYLKFLDELIKDNNEFIALTYMTGILPIKKYDGYSSINNIVEISMTSPCWMAKYVGFTENEVKELLKRYKGNEELDTLQNNSTSKKQKHDKNIKINDKEKNSLTNEEYEDLIHKNEPNLNNIKKRYEGYQLENEKTHEIYKIYSPWSIIKALRHNNIENHWNRTGTYLTLEKYITENFLGLKEDVIRLRNREKVTVDINTYQNDMASFTCKDDILTHLVHLGYLTYDSSSKQVYVPNEEVLNVFFLSTRSDQWNALERKLRKQNKT